MLSLSGKPRQIIQSATDLTVTVFDCDFDIMTWNCANCVVCACSVVTEDPTQ